MIAARPTFEWAGTAAEVNALRRTDPHAALALASAWLTHEEGLANSEGRARALWAHANALLFLGQYDAALDDYRAAERLLRALGLEADAAQTQISQVTALRYKGRYEEAVALALEARIVLLQCGDAFNAARLAVNLGTVYRPMGRLAEALRSYREARAVFRRLGEQSFVADVEQNIGNVLVDLGRYEQAFSRLRAAERIRRRLGLRVEVALTLLNIGILSRRRGDYGRALEVLSEARQIYEAAGVERGSRLVDLQLLPTLVALNLRDESREAAERAIEGMRRFDMPFELGQALLAAGALAELDGDVVQVGARIDEARAIFERLGNRVWEPLARLQRARLVLNPAAVAEPAERDDPDADRAPGDPAVPGDGRPEHIDDDGPLRQDDHVEILARALSESREATAAFLSVGALDHAAFGLLVEATILARLADTGAASQSKALARYRDVLTAAGALRADHLLYQAHAAVGELIRTADPDSAIESYRRAIDHLEAVRARARADDLKLSFLTDKTDLYERVVGLLVERGSADALAEAYSFVERSKSRTLLEDLLSGVAPIRGGRRSRVARLAQQIRDLRARLNTAYVQAYGSDAVPSSGSVSGSGHADTVTQLEQDFARATRELQLAARDERKGIEPTELDAGPPTLPAGVALVEFYAVGPDLLAFVVNADGLRLRHITTLEEVARLAERLNFQIGKMALGSEYIAANLDKLRTGIERPLQQLYQAIVAPLEEDLAESTRLVIVPHGPLHGLPFHAFHDGARYLAERFTIAYAPSASVYQACVRAARPIGDRAVVIGIDDPGLPWVAREVEAIATAWPEATVLQGRGATGRALRHRVGRFDALHLATHGVFRDDNPAFSSIKLHDSWLTVNDLAEVARGAQLVTLSACETGVNGLTAGDELIGLTRGILASGCSTVVASLWTVSDESTAHLMAHFYGRLRSGDEPAEALRAAMLALKPAYDHPYFWAPFAAVGGGLGWTGATGAGPESD